MLGNGKSKSGNTPQKLLNLIGTGTTIKGDIQCSGDIRIDGVVKGNIEVSQKLVVGPNGKVAGDITGSQISISGSVIGNVHADETTVLHGQSSVTGDIHTKQIIIEQGGVFNGHCKMGDNLNPVKPKVNETESAK
jgi:cytoskeletal protein CcmA (bactofilin family)